MYIAMNRFRIAPGRGEDFEAVWRNRDSHLKQVPGFVSFRLLRGPESEDSILYVSHSMWLSKAAFEAWTRSEAFRAAHANAGDSRGLHLAPPQFEGFETALAS